jgi:SAM-dependent methyltransferase
MKSQPEKPMGQHGGDAPVCWCGNDRLEPFSDDYLRCSQCETLVLRRVPAEDITRVHNDETDLYGRNYYLEHLQQDFGYPDIATRARTDLPERCLHWLRTVLKYKLPPGKVLELGSAHGAFVSMLRWSGFDAVGLELSPWVVEFARRTFDVPMLPGPLEDQTIEARSLDLIALMDVLEHLPSPLKTLARCLDLLKEDGILVIQTPRYPEGRRLEEMTAKHDRFVEQFKPQEHLYLYSQTSVQELLRRLGAIHTAFEPAIFAHYDMFLVASRSPLPTTSREQIEAALGSTPASRLIQSLLDVGDQSDALVKRLSIAEADRAARLDVIQQQGAEIGELSRSGEHSTEQYQELLAKMEKLQVELGDFRSRAEAQEQLTKNQSLELEQLRMGLQRAEEELVRGEQRAVAQASALATQEQLTKSQSIELEQLRMQLRQAEEERLRGERRATAQASALAAQEQIIKSRSIEVEQLRMQLRQAEEQRVRGEQRATAQANALDEALKSLEAARARGKELQLQLLDIDNRRMVRVLKWCGLWPK